MNLDSRSMQGILSRGKNVYRGTSHASGKAGRPKNSRTNRSLQTAAKRRLQRMKVYNGMG